MTDENVTQLPVWMLSTGDTAAPVPVDNQMTTARLAELRTALSAYSTSAITSLEVHPLSDSIDRMQGIPLDYASPLAGHLTRLLSQTGPVATPAAVKSGDVLYRMVVPAKVAAQVGQGVVRPMASTAVTGGVHGALMGSKGIAAQATFVPVGAAGTAAATAGALTVAAPLVLMAVAVAVSAQAEGERRKSIERITELLEKLGNDKLDDERNELDGCRDAIAKATALLLDEGHVGLSLGLDSAAHAISKAVASAERRATRWQQALDGFGEGKVDIGKLRDAFPGIDTPEGEFNAHLEIAKLAITLKRRVIVLQAVEHAQIAKGNPFETFVQALQKDHASLDAIESRIATVLRGLSELELTRSQGWRTFMYSPGEVDDLLRTSRQLHEMGRVAQIDRRPADVVIDMVRSDNGNVLVLPARAAS